MTDPVLYEQRGPIVVLTLNKPEVRNAISDQDMIDSLVNAVAQINVDQSVRAVILTGTGKAFSSGGNLNKIAEVATLSPVEIRNWYLNGIQRIPLALYTLEVPIIAAVNGPAIGAGCDLACMCDIRIAGQSALFAASFVKLGITPGDGGAWFLPRLVGLSKASELIFTGDSINATEALACGLVSKVVPDAQLIEAAHALAQRIAVNPGHALRMTKRLLREAQRVELATSLEMAAGMQALAHGTADHKEAVAAFLEKRAPHFTGE